MEGGGEDGEGFVVVVCAVVSMKGHVLQLVVQQVAFHVVKVVVVKVVVHILEVVASVVAVVGMMFVRLHLSEVDVRVYRMNLDM
jgi:hypothetical protein